MAAARSVWRRGNRCGALGLALALAVLAGGAGCGGGQRRCGPGQHDVRPARDVEAPPIALAGVRLGATADEVRAACAAAGGAAQAGGALVSCQPAGLREGRWAVWHWQVGFDSFGKARQLELSLGLGDDGAPPAVAHVVGAIDAALGGGSIAGGLPWCGTRGTCQAHDFAEWRFGGGEVRLRATIEAHALELELAHEDRDLVEQVTYGLPNCPG